MRKQAEDPNVVVDVTLPRSRRPMIGLDIEEWRAELALSKFEAQHALGFRNSNHYNKICSRDLLPFELELLIRLYEDNPVARGWTHFSMNELFELMYAADRDVFKGTHWERFAQVDLGNRFTKLLGRSPARQYSWLKKSNSASAVKEIKAYSVIECILAKLHQAKNPRETLERISKHAWSLRGVDIDLVCPIPTLKNPPDRIATGRKTKEYHDAVKAGIEPPPPRIRQPKAPVDSRKTSLSGSKSTVKAGAKTAAKDAGKTPLSALKKAVKATPAKQKAKTKVAAAKSTNR